MIDRITIRNFKTFREVDLRLGRVNLFVGGNSSGKSNFFDALRVLQGVARGYGIANVFDGMPRSDTADLWEGIRGGSSQACCRATPLAAAAAPDESVASDMQVRETSDAHADADREGDVQMGVSLALNRGNRSAHAAYELSVRPADGFLRRESLVVDERTLLRGELTFGRDDGVPEFSYFVGEPGSDDERGGAWDPYSSVVRSLSEFPDTWRERADAELARSVLQRLSDFQFLSPNVGVLRRYAADKPALRMGPSGEDFPAVVKAIVADPRRREAYVSWLAEMSAAQVLDVEVRPGAANDLLFALREAAGSFPASVVSDGTLRFAALVAAFFQPSMPRALLLEEIEDGLHPSRIRTLVNLLKTQATRSETQVFATTHSPVVLAWLREEDYATTFLCARDDRSGASRILPVTDVPKFRQLLETSSLGELLTGSFMEWQL